MNKKIKIIGITKVAEVLDITDLTARIIKSHLTLELILNSMLKEAIITDQSLELKKQSFVLKVDLCYALVPMDTDFKPLLLKLNKIRNDFAHNHDAKFDGTEARDLLNGVPKDYRNELNCFKNISTPLLIWHACFYCSFIFLNMAFSRLAEYKASQEIYNKQIDSFIEKLRPALKKEKGNNRNEKRRTDRQIEKVIQVIYENHEQ